MHKATYELIAELLRNPPNKLNRRQRAEQLATKFASDNPRFDRGRFLVACGIKL